MDLVLGRRLSADDVETAHRLLDQHQPLTTPRGPDYCANAGHIHAPTWPCDRHRWAERVLLAEDRGEVEGAPSNIRRLPA